MERDEKIFAFRPGKVFPATSVTGHGCDQMCLHCKGYHLRNMHSATTSDELLKLAEKVKNGGGGGMLISGGCDLRGTVPLNSFIPTIRRISEMGLEVNVHSGFLSPKEAKDLADAGVTVFSMDVHQDPTIISNVLNLQETPDRYGETIDNIINAGGRIVPHITIGFGAEDLLFSISLLKEKNIKEIVVLALVPTPGTDVYAPSEDGVLAAINILIESGFDVTLGCMRSRDYTKVETECIKMGIRRIANPSMKTVKWAEENGFEVEEIKKCCCL